jgi:hypothetical protein
MANKTVKKGFQSDPNSTFLQNLYSQLVGLSGGDKAYGKRATKYVKGGKAPGADVLLGAFSEHPFSRKIDLGGKAVGNSLGNTLGMVGSAVQAHPWATAGLGAMGLANISGLVDDDKIGGQLVGGLGAGIGSALAGVSPMTSIALGLGGGTLGSLFDKLRAKKEAEQQAMYQQQSY